jgi:hypothetical protein
MDFPNGKWRLASPHAARPGRAEEGQAFGIKDAPQARKRSIFVDLRNLPIDDPRTCLSAGRDSSAFLGLAGGFGRRIGARGAATAGLGRCGGLGRAALEEGRGVAHLAVVGA